MRRLIRIILIIFIVLLLGIFIYFIGNVFNYNKTKELPVIETSIQETEEKIHAKDDIEYEYHDELGIKNTKYNDGYVEYTFNIDDFYFKNNRKNIIQDRFLEVGFGSLFSDRSLLPVTDNFYKQKEENGWIDKKWGNYFPGYEEPDYMSSDTVPYAEIDDFRKNDKNGIIHFYIKEKCKDMKYNYKYYLNEDGWLDSMEYIDSEVISDHTKEIEYKNRVRVMKKEDNEYLFIIRSLSSSLLGEGYEYDLSICAISDELKEKKYDENVLPIDNSVWYLADCSKSESNFDNKIAMVYVHKSKKNDNVKFDKKYKISFDYDDNLTLINYDIVDVMDISEEEYRKIAKTGDFSIVKVQK